MQFAKARHQRRHMAAAEAGRRRDAQVAAGLDPAGRDAGLGIGDVGQQALTIFQKSATLMRQADAARGAYQQLDAQPFFQRIQPPAHDGRCHTLGMGRGGQAATRGHGDKGFHLLELVHVQIMNLGEGNSARARAIRERLG